MAVTDGAIVRIKRMIVSGELRPGDRLPSEADLANRLGLSRNSLREAIKALSLIRVLDVRQGDGTYVTSLEPRLLLDALNFVADFHRDDATLEFLEVRRILEPAAAALAAQRMTEDQIASLGALVDALDEPGMTVEKILANDREFHRQIAQGAGNGVLCSLIESMSGPTMHGRLWRGLTPAEALACIREQHTAIYAAIAARQPEEARTWAHVGVVRASMRVSAAGPDRLVA